MTDTNKHPGLIVQDEEVFTVSGYVLRANDRVRDCNGKIVTQCFNGWSALPGHLEPYHLVSTAGEIAPEHLLPGDEVEVPIEDLAPYCVIDEVAIAAIKDHGVSVRLVNRPDPTVSAPAPAQATAEPVRIDLHARLKKVTAERDAALDTLNFEREARIRADHDGADETIRADAAEAKLAQIRDDLRRLAAEGSFAEGKAAEADLERWFGITRIPARWSDETEVAA